MKEIKMNRVGFNAEAVSAMTEKDFIDTHIKGGVYEAYPSKERYEMLKTVYKRSCDMCAVKKPIDN